jgi:hypothetical protein
MLLFKTIFNNGKPQENIKVGLREEDNTGQHKFCNGKQE